MEKVIHSIFSKLGLAWEDSAHKRVKAVLLYLADREADTQASAGSCRTAVVPRPGHRMRP